MAFNVVWGGLVSGGSFGLIGVVVLWLSQRMALAPRAVAGESTGGSNNPCSPLFLALLAPWALLYCQTLRGFEGRCGGLLLSNNFLRLGGFYQFLLPLSFFAAAPATARALGSKVWSLEQIGAVILLQLTWLLSLQSSTLLSTLLWFEVASLLGVLLLGLSGLSAVGGGCSRDRYRSLSGQRGLVTALLTLLWTSGLSTVLIVWGWGVFSLRTPGLDFETASLLLAFPHLGGVASNGVGTGYIIGTGVLLKLLIQPVQFFILSFYRTLPLGAFAVYLSSYYVGFVPALLGVILTPLTPLLAPWSLLLAAAICATVGVLAGGIDHAADVRTTVAFSTMLNLTLLLVALTV